MKHGYIEISDTAYKNNWNMIAQIFKDFKPFHIEHGFNKANCWTFWGESDLFDEIKEDDITPRYEVVFTVHPKASSEDPDTYTHYFVKAH